MKASSRERQGGRCDRKAQRCQGKGVADSFGVVRPPPPWSPSGGAAGGKGGEHWMGQGGGQQQQSRLGRPASRRTLGEASRKLRTYQAYTRGGTRRGER